MSPGGRSTQFLRRFRIARYSNGRLLVLAIATLTLVVYGTLLVDSVTQRLMSSEALLTDPFLQLPTETSVRVVWFTEFAGDRHQVEYGENLAQRVAATTTKLSRVREDQKSRVASQIEDGQLYQAPVFRDIWRHEAEVSELQPGDRIPYRVVSTTGDGQTIHSRAFTLAAAPPPGQPLKILLTSDHQSMPMTPANLQKVVETVGAVDAVFLAGDLVNIPDRASEWFDDNRGRAFFPSLQGRASNELEYEGEKTRYVGGAIIQSAPLFPAIGNHEVMGRFSMKRDLGEQFNDPYPRWAAKTLEEYPFQDSADPEAEALWLKNNSFNSDTYQEIFTLPEQGSGDGRYYAVTFGDIRLVVLYATNIWRPPSLDDNAKGRYRERNDALNDPARWGYGQHIFEAIAKGSPQYNWLESELRSPEFQQARYKLVMFHHPPHSLGDNIVPAYTDPVQIIERDDDSQITAVRYEYPKDADHLIRDVAPLLERAGVQLVFYGHSHLWNRFVSSSGTNYLESSNVGNTYGAFLNDKKRPIPAGYKEEYVALGDPNQLEPIVPTLDPLRDETGQPLPYISSNSITVFSILDTETGTVSSYRFDTEQPNSPVIKFDEFSLLGPTDS